MPRLLFVVDVWEASSMINQTCDVLVVGGGIHGLGIAWDASLRGLKVVLVEKSDFGSGATAGCFRIIHGGFRYLQSLDFNRLLKSAREQQFWRQCAPHMVSPLPIVVPTYGSSAVDSRFALQLGAFAYETCAFWRNSNVSDMAKLPRASWISAKECAEVVPFILKSRSGRSDLSQGKPQGALRFYDAQVSHAERFAWLVAKSAQKAGAEMLNYTEFLGIGDQSADAKTHSDFLLREVESQKEFHISARALVVSAGPWTSAILSRLNVEPPKPAVASCYSRGIQIVVPKITNGVGVSIPSERADGPEQATKNGKRRLFVVPAGATAPQSEFSMLGTSDWNFQNGPETFRISSADVSHFLAEVKAACPAPELTEASIVHAFGGLVPMDPASQTSSHLTRDLISEHQLGKAVTACISVVGVKYTTFRSVAELVVDRICKKFGMNSASRTLNSAVHSANFEDVEADYLQLDKDSAGLIPKESFPRLFSLYGTDVSRLCEMIEKERRFSEQIDTRTKTLAVEIAFAVKEESARRLSDVVQRRTILGSLGKPQGDALQRAAIIMAETQGWSDNQIKEHAQLLERSFPV